MEEEATVAQWMGSYYQVVLKEPAGQCIQGILTGLVPQQHLTLAPAMVLGTNQFYDRLNVDAMNVYDITPLQNTSFPMPTPSVVSPPIPTIPPVKRPQPAFQDPAILSLTPRSDSTTHFTHPPTQPNIAEKRDPPFVTNPADRMTYDSPDEITDAAAPTNITAPMTQLKISPNPEAIHIPRETTESLPTIPHDPSDPRKDRSRGTRGRGRRKNKIADGNGAPAQRNSRGPGWRETPILQSTESFQPFKALKKSQKARIDALADNGWASEDVTDVQGAGDFDFEGSLAKFDKRKIFDEMKEQDKIDESERLVSHNRLPRPKPGTAGGKNLHYTENVLDMPATTLKPKETSGDYWKSEADDEILNGAEHSGSGRNSRLRGESRVSINRRSQSRKASTTASVAGSSRVNSGQSASIPSGFYAVKSNRRIEAIAHLPMQTLENVARHEFGFTEDLLAENAGRGITEVVMLALNDPAITLRAAATSPPSNPTVAVLAGNNKSGVRALAAARHLRNRSINVLICVVGIEREKELLDDVRKQIRLLRNFGSVIFTKTELFEHTSHTSSTLESASQGSITLIIDALLGLTTPFEELRKSDQATTYELMEWSNRNEAFAMAIDLPSGIEPQSGKVNVIDGAKLYVQPRYIVALGAPKLGLLKALEMGDENGDIVMVEQWKIFLADIGLSPVIWRKVATKIRRGIEFDNNWVLELRYQPQVDGVDD
ncbi:YjeF N-terminal domain-like protein [Annulohypoxylon truncatum]|uniref:YjeF N-terminal domain-like protein n=1 Tax=Annulohypoxylon truncatum TaxID=327061 RepID=UPI00200736E9|nr:YjeF N-terminal domain-like protein [Annulohypoxylon truncatum]KAI1206595.1 YjeF N-terminal domain-like protein [Annulohypoxylon truncatum]